MKLVTETRIVRGGHTSLGLGPKAKLIADTNYTYDSRIGLFGAYRHHQNGKLRYRNELTSFCTAGFARIFGINATELKKIFGKNTVSRVRITIEVLDSEEWEYTK